MYGLFALDILSYGRIVTVDAVLSHIVADRYCSYVFTLMVSTPVKVIRRQVRRPARPFQVEISSVSFLDVISAKSLQIGIDLMYLLLGDRRQVRRQTRPLQVEISLQKGFLALISEVLIDGNKLVIAALSQIDVEIGCP